MNTITIKYPGHVIFGNGSLDTFIQEFLHRKYHKPFIITFPEILPALEKSLHLLEKGGMTLVIDTSIITEPSFGSFEKVLAHARQEKVDSVIGIGGGSILDVAKLTAALLKNNQQLEDIAGINKLNQRKTFLACLPTTSGTGSEMSPNAILLDEQTNLKTGIVSPFLLADISCIDPLLTLSAPPSVTASTGIDAFTHCLEAYVNKFSHPLVDTFALKGLQLIYKNLKRATDNGDDTEARAAVALGSMYGGMCLGPVNTTAIHALSYPLGSEYHIAHGLSNALLMTAVVEYNLPVSYRRYATIARTLGIEEKDDRIAAELLVKNLRSWLQELKIPAGMSAVDIPEDAIPRMAKAAITIERLLRNNPRKITLEDAIQIYNHAY